MKRGKETKEKKEKKKGENLGIANLFTHKPYFMFFLSVSVPVFFVV